MIAVDPAATCPLILRLGVPGILVIEMRGTAYVAPNGTDDATIPLGATVEWVNRDALRHTATGSSMPPGTPMLNSGLMSQGDRYQYTPPVTGTWTYFCQTHPATWRARNGG